MKKVAFYLSKLGVGGTEKVFIETINALNTGKYQIDVIFRYKYANENFMYDFIPKNVNIRYLISEKTTTKYLELKDKKKNFLEKIMFKYIKKIMEKEREERISKLQKYDVLINFDFNYSSGLKIKSEKRVQWINISLWDREDNFESKEKLRQKGLKLEKYDKIVAICDDMKKEMETILPDLKGKIVRVYNAFDLENIRKKGMEEIDYTDLKNEEFIVSVMRLDLGSKDFNTLFKGLQKFNEKFNKKLKLYILGEGKEDRSKIEKLIKEYNMGDAVILLGNQENPYKWIKNSKFLIHSSKTEGLPNALIEAQILGRAVISTNCPTGPREILEDGKSGILFPVGNHEQLALEIEKLYFNPLLRIEYEKNGLESAKRFDKKNIMKEIESLIETI